MVSVSSGMRKMWPGGQGPGVSAIDARVTPWSYTLTKSYPAQSTFVVGRDSEADVAGSHSVLQAGICDPGSSRVPLCNARSRSPPLCSNRDPVPPQRRSDTQLGHPRFALEAFPECKDPWSDSDSTCRLLAKRAFHRYTAEVAYSFPNGCQP